MREIKFRGWGGKEMIERALGGDISPAKKEFGIDFPASYSLYFSTGNMLVLMQFTGLTDVNGVDIYEGDVVKGQRYLDRPGQFARFIGAVEYDPWWGAYRRKGVKQYQGLDADLRHGRELEVIGNVFANPELLERP